MTAGLSIPPTMSSERTSRRSHRPSSPRTGGKVSWIGAGDICSTRPTFHPILALQAQSSQAKVIGLANSGADTISAIKQGAEFGVGKSGQKLVALLAYITDVNSMGLEAAQGLLLTDAFYWDMNDETRAWSRRYFDKMKRKCRTWFRQAAPIPPPSTISKQSRPPEPSSPAPL